MSETIILTNAPVVAYLKRITKLIEENRFEELEKNYTFYSYEGDGSGMENTCIDFSPVLESQKIDGVLDFGDVLRLLKEKQQRKMLRVAELKKEIEEVQAL